MNTKYQIYQGDCHEILPTLDDNLVDVVIADPDYGVGINYNKRYENWSVSVPKKTPRDLEEDLIPFLTECRRITKRDIVTFWSGSIGRIHDFLDIVEGKFNVQYMGIWYKPNGAGPTGNGLSRRFEVWFWIEGKDKRKGEWRFLSDVIQENRITRISKESLKHPTQKPVALMEKLVRFFSRPGDTVLDPYLGSGTTMKACQNTGRSCIGIEINPLFCEMARERVFGQQYFGREVEYEFNVH